MFALDLAVNNYRMKAPPSRARGRDATSFAKTLQFVAVHRSPRELQDISSSSPCLPPVVGFNSIVRSIRRRGEPRDHGRR
jgi:hypothetical protein